MSENISSNVLFHITSRLSYLKDILSSGFHPRYCPEYLVGADQDLAASQREMPSQAAPMVCFCDLPLSLIGRHLRQYGRFGIGLRKEWGLKHGVTPVFYAHKESRLLLLFAKRTLDAFHRNDAESMHTQRMLMALLKPITGYAWRKRKRTKKKIHFYDEREWRYAPSIPIGETVFLTRDEYPDKRKVEAIHAIFRKRFSLRIGPDDIQYLIVPDERRVFQLAEFIDTLYDRRNATLVKTAIMTTDCITEDV